MYLHIDRIVWLALALTVVSAYDLGSGGATLLAPLALGIPQRRLNSGDDSCEWANDEVCDVPDYCPEGTDASDCDTSDDSCEWANDEVCDVPDYCPEGTDASDCDASPTNTPTNTPTNAPTNSLANAPTLLKRTTIGTDSTFVTCKWTRNVGPPLN
jgi:hypothetical protein